MNRKGRREIQKQLRSAGMTKAQAKEYVNQNYKNATATIKLNDGTEQVVDLGNVTDVNDPKIQEKINSVLQEEE